MIVNDSNDTTNGGQQTSVPNPYFCLCYNMQNFKHVSNRILHLSTILFVFH